MGILLITENEKLAEEVSKALSPLNVKLERASNVTDFLARHSSSPYDAVFIDIDSVEEVLTQAVKIFREYSSTKDKPLAVFSTSPDSLMTRMKIKAAGVSNIFLNPPDHMELKIFTAKTLGITWEKPQNIGEKQDDLQLNRGKIALVIDDSELSRVQLENILKKMGMDVILGSNGIAGVAFAHHARPHILLTDIVMPVMDGLELIKRLRSDSTFKVLPIIAMSTKSDKENVLQALTIGANDFISKPFEEKFMREKVEFWLREFAEMR